MDSSALISNKGKEEENPFQIGKTLSSRHTRSFGCSSSFSPSSSSFGSSSSFSYLDFPLSPMSPLRSTGVPFSWEQQPGIPKQSPTLSSKKKAVSSLDLLPLPPGKKKSEETSVGDPFAAALMECCKDHLQVTKQCWKSAKVSTTLSDRYGFVDLYGSCKRTLSVSESIVSLPRSNRTGFSLLNRRSR